MKTVLQDMNNPHAGGTSSTRLLNHVVPQRYFVNDHDTHEQRLRKTKLYAQWCKARKMPVELLPGMIAPKPRVSPDDPIPPKYYPKENDTLYTQRGKYYAFKDWCNARGIEFHPLPGMYVPNPKHQPNRHMPTAAEAAANRKAINKPKWHERNTYYDELQVKLTELCKQRDECQDYDRWQELQTQINVLRVKCQSWQNEKADRKNVSVNAIYRQNV